MVWIFSSMNALQEAPVMKFLVEIDHPKTGQWLNDAAARVFVDEVVIPTLQRAEALIAEGCILAGGPVAGSIALRFVAEVESSQHLDALVSSMPLWAVAYTRVTPLIEFSDRRQSLQKCMPRRALPDGCAER
jgi:muconolactone delta-isomerase